MICSQVILPKTEESVPTHPQINQKAINERRFWYSRVFIGLEICKSSRGRELNFLGAGYSRELPIRYMNCAFLDVLYKHLGLPNDYEKENNQKPSDAWHFFKKNYNVYISLAEIDWANCPTKALSYANKQRKEEQLEFKNLIHQNFTNFSGCIDFDGNQSYEWQFNKRLNINEQVEVKLDITQEESVERALKDAKKVIKIFNGYGIKWHINFSGTKGFHIWYEIPLDITINQKCDLGTAIMRELAIILKLNTIDRRKFNLRKVFKCPYSVVTTLESDKTYVVLPLENDMLDGFKLEDVEVRKVYTNRDIRLKNRGVLWKNDNLNKEQLTKNFKKFLKDFEIKIPIDRKFD